MCSQFPKGERVYGWRPGPLKQSIFLWKPARNAFLLFKSGQKYDLI